MWCVCRKPSNVSETWISQEVTLLYTPSHRPHIGFGCPAVLVRADMEEDTEIYASGVRWVAVRLVSRAVLVIGALHDRAFYPMGKRSKRSRVALTVSSLLLLGTMWCWVPMPIRQSEWIQRWSICW